jgi:hypothetical protein
MDCDIGLTCDTVNKTFSIMFMFKSVRCFQNVHGDLSLQKFITNNDLTKSWKLYLFMSEYVGDCCLTQKGQFFSYMMERRSCCISMTWWWSLFCTRTTRLVCFSLSWLRANQTFLIFHTTARLAEKELKLVYSGPLISPNRGWNPWTTTYRRRLYKLTTCVLSICLVLYDNKICLK